MTAILTYTFVLLIAIVLLSLFISKIRIWKPKRTFWFALVYLVCGLLAFGYLLFMSSNVEKAASRNYLQQQRDENEQLIADLKVRKFESLREEHLKFTKTFEATEEHVEVIHDENSYYLPVVISWVDSTENTIVASYYETPLYLNRMNISPFIEFPSIEMKDNKIYISDKGVEVTAKSMYISLDILNANSGKFSDNLNDLVGERILHLNVPKHFNIIDSGGWYW